MPEIYGYTTDEFLPMPTRRLHGSWRHGRYLIAAPFERDHLRQAATPPAITFIDCIAPPTRARRLLKAWLASDRIMPYNPIGITKYARKGGPLIMRKNSQFLAPGVLVATLGLMAGIL